MKTPYQHPTTTLLPVCMTNTLCVSEIDNNLNSNGTGEDPWNYGRAPMMY